jgi:hypothetical protein
MKFSGHFRLRQSQAELDFVDITIDEDTPLFVDPSTFGDREDEWSARCHNLVVSFFQSAIDAIRTGHNDRAIALLNNLSEPNETCLGFSSARPSGRGVGGQQAADLHQRLAASRAVRTGMLTDLQECELLVPGIGPDKISDITTNIVRIALIEYTQDQCRLHGIPMRGTIASGLLWDPHNHRWYQEYVELPVVRGRKLLLVPKFSVRYGLSFSHGQFYQHYVLNFLRDQYLSTGNALVKVLKSGERVVYKKDVSERHPLTKDFLFEFSTHNPGVLHRYKEQHKGSRPPNNSDLDARLDEPALAKALSDELREVPPGDEGATQYHRLMKGILTFLFYPSLIYPKVEAEINEGRKRIDILYVNSADSGIFRRIPTTRRITAVRIPVECKNYGSDPGNPELDQLAGRFSANRGWVGLLTVRTFLNRDQFVRRCRDTAQEQRGFIIPLADEDIHAMLEMIQRNKRRDIDAHVERIFGQLVT